MTCDAIERDFSLLGGRVDVTNQEVENLECQVIDLEGKLVKLAALEATELLTLSIGSEQA